MQGKSIREDGEMRFAKEVQQFSNNNGDGEDILPRHSKNIGDGHCNGLSSIGFAQNPRLHNQQVAKGRA